MAGPHALGGAHDFRAAGRHAEVGQRKAPAERPGSCALDALAAILETGRREALRLRLRGQRADLARRQARKGSGAGEILASRQKEPLIGSWRGHAAPQSSVRRLRGFFLQLLEDERIKRSAALRLFLRVNAPSELASRRVRRDRLRQRGVVWSPRAKRDFQPNSAEDKLFKVKQSLFTKSRPNIPIVFRWLMEAGCSRLLPDRLKTLDAMPDFGDCR